MAKHGRNVVLFGTAISLSVLLISAAPASANPGAAGEELQGIVDFLREAVNGVADLLGLRNGATTSFGSSGSGCAAASATASGDCPSASRVASAGGTAVVSEPIAPAVPGSAAAPARLAFTGSLTGHLAALAGVMMIAGFSLVRLGRRRAAPLY